MENENIIKALHDLQFLEKELRAIAQDADKLKALNAELVHALTLVCELSDRNDYETYYDSIHKIVRPVLEKASK